MVHPAKTSCELSRPHWSLPIPFSLLLHRRLDRLLLVRIDLGFGGVEVGLPVHPLVEAGALEAPTIAQLECRNETLRGVLVQSVGRDAKVVRCLADIHYFADFGNQQVGAGCGAAHDCLPEMVS